MKWIEFAGGKCPVPNHTQIQFRLRNGTIHRTDMPQVYFWKHDASQADVDIVAYKIELKGFWRNVWECLKLGALTP